MTGWARVPLNKPDPQSGSILTATVLALAICVSLVFAMAQTKTPSAAMVPLFEDVSHQADLSVSQRLLMTTSMVTANWTLPW